MSTVPGNSPDHRLRLLTRYCEIGWRLLPTWWRDTTGTCACRERERCDRPGKHPRISWQNPAPGRPGASSNIAVVTEWFRLWPRANWAVVCDDFFAVDVDEKHGGMVTLAEIERNAPELTATTLTQETSGGGRQLLYAQPPERDVVTTAQGRLRGLTGWEVRGLALDGSPGTYVLVPPSAGRRWLVTGLPRPASPELLARIRQARETRGGSSGTGTGNLVTFDWDAALTPGAVTEAQDETLYRAALSLRAQGVGDGTALAVLRRVVLNFTNLDPRDPWDPVRAEQKWEYVKRRHEAGRTAPRMTPDQLRWAAVRGQRARGDSPIRVGRVTVVPRGDR